MTFDPTPPSDDHPGGFMAQLGLYWDWFQLQWNDWVVNYDFVHQFTLAQGVQRVSRRYTARIREIFEQARSAGAMRVRHWAGTANSIPPWVLILLALLSIGVLLASNRGVRKRLVFACRIKLGHEPPSAEAASFFYQRMLRLVERAGWRKSPSQTPLEFAASLPADEIAAPVTRFTDLCMAARFGGYGIEASRLASLLEEVKLSLRARTRRGPRMHQTKGNEKKGIT
jgi:hypothetical protein